MSLRISAYYHTKEARDGRTLLLDVIICKLVCIQFIMLEKALTRKHLIALELFVHEEEVLLIWWNTPFILDLLLDLINSIRGVDF